MSFERLTSTARRLFLSVSSGTCAKLRFPCHSRFLGVRVSEFDARESAHLRDEGIARAEEHADHSYKLALRHCIDRCARDLPEFTMDEVMILMKAWFPTVSTHEPRVAGAVVRAAIRDGVISLTDRTRRTIQSQSHRRPMSIYASNLHQSS